MALTKISNQSLSSISSLPATLPTGALTLLSTQTASSSASISFTSGIDSTYDSYVFKFIDIHPATDDTSFSFQVSTDGGSNYNTTITSSSSHAYHAEADNDTNLRYWLDHDQAQGTSFQNLMLRVSNDDDYAHVGTLQIFQPSSPTFVKHFISRLQTVYYYDGGIANAGYSMDDYIAGYANTTSAINAVQFKMTSGNIDAGVIKLYGVS